MVSCEKGFILGHYHQIKHKYFISYLELDSLKTIDQTHIMRHNNFLRTMGTIEMNDFIGNFDSCCDLQQTKNPTLFTPFMAWKYLSNIKKMLHPNLSLHSTNQNVAPSLVSKLHITSNTTMNSGTILIFWQQLHQLITIMGKLLLLHAT
jgi:hypothetical protein